MICVVSDGNIPSIKAHSFNVVKMANGFAKTGQDVILVSLLSLPNIIERLRRGDLFSFYGVEKNFSIKLLPVWSRDFFKKTIGISGYPEVAAKWISEKKSDFAYCRSYRVPIYLIKRGINIFLETHTTLYTNTDLIEILSYSNRKEFLGLVTINEELRNNYIRMGVPPEKILVLEDGVNLEQYKITDDRYEWRKNLGLPLNKKLVVYCGSLYKEKGIGEIIKIAKHFENEPDFHFIAVGGNHEQVSFWKNETLQKNIHNLDFIGFVPNNFVPRYLKSADVLVMPYNLEQDFSIMDIHTTSPIKLFEYMASNRPIVTTDIPVLRKILKHNISASLCKPGNYSELALSIKRYATDPLLAKNVSDAAFKDVLMFDWKERCQKILDFYRNTITERGTSHET